MTKNLSTYHFEEMEEVVSYNASQKKGYPLKSSNSVERSNLNALTP